MKGFILLNILLGLTCLISPSFAQTTPCSIAVKTTGIGTVCPNQGATQANTGSTNIYSYLYCAPTSTGSNPALQWVLAYCSGGPYNPITKKCPAVATTTTTPGSTTASTTSTTTASPGTKPSCTGSNNGATFPNPTSNTLFYICVNGEALSTQCSANTVYSQVFGSCTSNSAGNGLCPAGVTTLIASPMNCQSYISCVNGQGTPFQCPFGQYFNPSMGACSVNRPASCNYGSNNNNIYYPNNPIFNPNNPTYYPNNPIYYPNNPIYYPNNPIYYPNNIDLGTNYGTDSFPVYEASCYPNCNVNNNNYYPNNVYPINNYPNNYYPNNNYPNNYYPNSNYPNNYYPNIPIPILGRNDNDEE